ncbi:AMP-binding protein [Micrococcus lylae]|uniref:phenylacetate--CoA ligase family protein n=1 Tax=Micrococcus lylae TaxID=1273 RepID=UPI0021A602AE|nr:AMP-binding protein [Micrococcus lylae]MCT2006444.1 AMP-binding protein [Micrococcus lylae]MCT2071056.1 AMP-binding protein [Micrococcus lylae]
MIEASIPNPYTPAPVPANPAERGRRDPEETMSRDQIEAIQFERLRWTLHHAYENVEAYKEHFDAHGVHPSDFKELADLAKFPYTDKEFLRKSYPFKAFAAKGPELRRIHASSGTTGQPTVVGYTDNDIATWASLVARVLRNAGVKPGDRVHNAYGYGLFTGGLGAHYGVERCGAAVIPMSGGQTEKQVQLIKDFEPSAILSTPTYLLTIADGFRKMGLDPRETSLKTAVLGAEPWTEEMRREIEQTFGLDALDIYGLSEVMGPGVAGESAESKDGSHIYEDHFRPEIIDPFTDEVLETGHPGELVFTSLTKEALPIIRYRTHDLTRLLPGTALPGHRRMGRITGRSDDMIILRGVNLFPSQIEELALQIPALSPHFTLEITRPNRMDEMAVNIERRPEFSRQDAESGARALQKEIKTKIGSSCTINVVEPDTLVRSSGKLRRVYDRRND